MRHLRSWSGIVSVILLFTGLLIDSSNDSFAAIALLVVAALFYVLFFYNFALTLEKFQGLTNRLGLAASAIGVVGTFLAVASFGVSGPIGWLLLGIAMLGIAWGVLRARLLPDGFAWLSGLIGIITIASGVTGDTSDIGTGAAYVVLTWVISMSIMFIVWGHIGDDDQNPVSDTDG